MYPLRHRRPRLTTPFGATNRYPSLDPTVMLNQTFDHECLHTELARLLEALKPRSVLCVGKPAVSLLAHATTRYTATSVSTLALDEIPGRLDQLPHYDLAYVHGALERLPRSAAGMLLARLRDISARRLLVHVEIGAERSEHISDWENNELLAFGLIKAGEYQTSQCRAHFYQFNIFDYKLTPDWFNPKDWAHPHLWRP